MIVSVDELLGGHERVMRTVRLPSSGRELVVRMLSGGEALRLADEIGRADTIEAKLALQIAAYVCNQAGAAYFDVSQAARFIETFAQADVRAVMDAALEVNRVDDEAIEAARKN